MLPCWRKHPPDMLLPEEQGMQVLVKCHLPLVFDDDFGDPVVGGDQTCNCHVLPEEVAFGSPAESPGNVSGQYHCKLVVWVLPAEEEQVIIGFPVIPGP